MFLLKTAMISSKKTVLNEGGFDNLAYTANALNADYLEYQNLNYESLAQYQMILLVDIKDYRICNGAGQKIRKMYPNMFMGWHQESCCANIFRRHKCYGNSTVSEESWDVNVLSIWKTIMACDFIICHNKNDFSLSFYNIFSDNKPCFSLSPFLPTEEAVKYFKPIEEKEKVISIGYNYDWREGGFLGYLIAQHFTDYEMIQQQRGKLNNPVQRVAIDNINYNFSKRIVTTIPHIDDRIKMAHFFAKCYVAINLREPTACRTNSVCAAGGTPMIGNEQSDVQRKLFPDLSINKYDLTRGKELLRTLINDKDFYNNCVKVAKENLWQAGIEQSTKELTEGILKIYEAKK
jgi:hypothetical protein